MFPNLSTERAYPLDATGFTEKSAAELTKAISDAVKGTQSTIIRALPDRLILTAKQYSLLTGTPEMMMFEDYDQEYFLYRTKYNVMEVEVKKT